jgi:hypothetical protein
MKRTIHLPSHATIPSTWLALVSLSLPLGSPARSATSDALQLADQGHALTSIVISSNASDATKAVATDLADYLGQMSGLCNRDSSRHIVSC